jgi:hypothetical protein
MSAFGASTGFVTGAPACFASNALGASTGFATGAPACFATNALGASTGFATGAWCAACLSATLGALGAVDKRCIAFLAGGGRAAAGTIAAFSFGSAILAATLLGDAVVCNAAVLFACTAFTASFAGLA